LSKKTTTHYPPSKVTITCPHHPFQWQSLEVLRHTHRDGSLQFVRILPDGSKSLILAEWTNFDGAATAPASYSLLGTLDDLLRVRSLVVVAKAAEELCNVRLEPVAGRFSYGRFSFSTCHTTFEQATRGRDDRALHRFMRATLSEVDRK
jgi:hypothetical protein